MTIRTDPSPDDYRVPFAPEGTVEFTPEERVDFRKSSLDRLASDAMRLAEPSHAADPESLDTRRIEFGGTAIDAVNVAPDRIPEQLDLAHPDTIRAHGAWIAHIRQAELDDTDKAA